MAERFFVASMATETNTFAPVLADYSSFAESFLYPPGRHPAWPSLCSGPHIALRELAAGAGMVAIEGTAAWAEPAGIVQQAAYVRLRDAILSELEAALPVDAVLLGLHGAMVAQECDDCEGELMAMVRERIGPAAVLAASFDPHSHLTGQRIDCADLIVAFKEFPHTDSLMRARELAQLALRTVRGEVRPTLAVHDCRMIDVFPTDQEPMRSFVERLRAIERDDPKVLDISVIHGFMAADVADVGTKIIVIADADQAHAQRLADELGADLFALRGTTRMSMRSPQEALELAAEPAFGKPTVIADVWDNPGGGTAGDDTRLLRLLIERDEADAALGPLWDPQAVRMCFAAGEGARIPLRIGAKCAPGCGEPVDAIAAVRKLVRAAEQTFAGNRVAMGDCAAVAVGGVEVVLSSVRAQAFGTDLFANLGIDPASRRVLVVKSTNHFSAAYAPIAGRILHCDTGTAAYPHDPRTTAYTKLKRPIWPRCADPHGR